MSKQQINDLKRELNNLLVKKAKAKFNCPFSEVEEMDEIENRYKNQIVSLLAEIKRLE